MPKLTQNREYCSIARALELLGERWTLLIVRDLLGGAKRFGELQRLVVGVTPKWLTARLRALEDAGVVERDGRAYRLTARGQDLRPALEELLIWSTAHDARPPRAGELIVPEHDMWSLEVVLNRLAPRLNGPVSWSIRLKDGGDHVLATDGESWRWIAGERDGDVVVATTARRWATLLHNARAGRDSRPDWFMITGDPEKLAEFRTLMRIR